MNDERNLAPGATSVGDPSGIRRRDDGSIDIDYYARRACQLHSWYTNSLIDRFIRFSRFHSGIPAWASNNREGREYQKSEMKSSIRNDLMKYQGSCHCGQVRFEAEGNLEKVVQCNCSICSKRGSLHWFITRENFHLLSPEDGMGTYTFNQHTIRHHHCLKCGCALFSEGIAPSGKDMVAINARCLDGVDLSPIMVRHFDGRSL